MLDDQPTGLSEFSGSSGLSGSAEIAALADRVATARGKLPLQTDPALFAELSEAEIAAERELAEWIRTQRRQQRRRAVTAELAAEKRDRRVGGAIRRADDADARWHRKALAARRRVSSPDARLAQLFRRAEWSSRALIAVVVLGMVWSGVNVQHNLVPSGDLSDPLYWLSYGLEAMISIPIITIMVVATTATRWGREIARGKVVLLEAVLLGITIALNAGPHLAAHELSHAAEAAVAPIMVGVVIWLHAWVSARYAQLIDGSPVSDTAESQRPVEAARTDTGPGYEFEAIDRISATRALELRHSEHESLTGADHFTVIAGSAESVTVPPNPRPDDRATDTTARLSTVNSHRMVPDNPDCGELPRRPNGIRQSDRFDPGAAAEHNGHSIDAPQGGEAPIDHTQDHPDQQAPPPQPTARTNGVTPPLIGYPLPHPISGDDVGTTGTRNEHRAHNGYQAAPSAPDTGAGYHNGLGDRRHPGPMTPDGHPLPPPIEADRIPPQRPSPGESSGEIRKPQARHTSRSASDHTTIAELPVAQVVVAVADPRSMNSEAALDNPGDRRKSRSREAIERTAQLTLDEHAAVEARTGARQPLAVTTAIDSNTDSIGAGPIDGTGTSVDDTTGSVDDTMESEWVDDSATDTDDIEVWSVAREISARGLSKLSVEQLAEVLTLAEESWTPAAIGASIGMPGSRVLGILEAARRIRPHAVTN